MNRHLKTMKDGKVKQVMSAWRGWEMKKVKEGEYS
jgi:hypothetical protein